jgi:hypothetical protein
MKYLLSVLLALALAGCAMPDNSGTDGNAPRHAQGLYFQSSAGVAH